MNKTALILLILLIVLVVEGLALLALNCLTKNPALSIQTEKTEYGEGDALKIAVKNNSGKSVCFSSCYPYLFEKKNGEWSLYPYSQCSKPNVNGVCLNGHQSKFFEITLSSIAAGIHRLSLPACLNCRDKDGFKKDGVFYSNEFSIK